MSATEEQMQLVSDAGVTHVSYVLVFYSLAFLLYFSEFHVLPRRAFSTFCPYPLRPRRALLLQVPPAVSSVSLPPLEASALQHLWHNADTDHSQVVNVLLHLYYIGAVRPTRDATLGSDPSRHPSSRLSHSRHASRSHRQATPPYPTHPHPTGTPADPSQRNPSAQHTDPRQANGHAPVSSQRSSAVNVTAKKKQKMMGSRRIITPAEAEAFELEALISSDDDDGDDVDDDPKGGSGGGSGGEARRI